MLQRVDDLVVILGRKSFDFRPFASLEGLTNVAVATFRDMRSTNESANSRDDSNTAIAVRVRAFLKFAMTQNDATFGIKICLSYKEYLKRNRRPTVQTSYYVICVAVMKRAICEGLCKHFQIPRGLSMAKAMAAADTRKTLADELEGRDVGAVSQNDLNRRILYLLQEFCWKRVHQVRDRQRAGWKWKQDAEELLCVVKPDGALKSWSREMLLRYLVQRHWLDASGITTFHARDDRISALRRETKALLAEPALRHHAITMLEVNDHLLPTMEQIDAFLPLFAVKRMNPVSIARLKTNMLVGHQDSSLGSKYIYVPKGRAGRELVFGPYAVGGDNARTTPRAFLLLKEVTDRIRHMAEPEYQDWLVLGTHLQRENGNHLLTVPCEISKLVHRLKTVVRKDVDARYDILRRLQGRWNLRSIRATVLTTDRHRGTPRSTQRLAQHKRMETTTIYLNTPSIAAMLDHQIEQGQISFTKTIRDGLSIIPATVEAVIKETGCDTSMAKSVLDNEMNLGFGASLVDEHAFIVDTPLNFLRMETWHRKIEAAQERIEANNPERWDAYWAPQLALYRQALARFPRKTAFAAKALNVDLFFPDPE